MNYTNENISVVMLGASGAVGTQVVKRFLKSKQPKNLILLGRRSIDTIQADFVQQHEINIFDPNSYAPFVKNTSVAICTLGVGEPSKMSKEEFLKIDKQAVLDFAQICKKNGVRHFELLSSVGISATSSNFFLRSKGELVAELEKLQFARLSIFQPSMILTPTNRYGISQAIVLKVWPKLNLFLHGNWLKYRGIAVEKLGVAIAENIFSNGSGLEILQYEDFNRISERG
ncbi:NAD(P)H-binding protein [Flavobacterium sp. Arc3]|uniref:NAD(P)H-binding protein n=1 Tax=Flavobacterium sp. Arc3 TaxID=3046686 RepID=UPI00352F6B21